MTVSSGFFNSVNHDRLYDAEQVSSIFDGIIIDGVYENYGEAFSVTPYSDANSVVIIGTGRAWFDHTWTLNDSQFSIALDPPNEMLGRTDAIVIDVNRDRSVRKNSIVYVKGSESSPDIPPELINTELHKQYPICWITRPAGSNAPIKQSEITYLVGTSRCPMVTGILEAQNLENLMAQLDDEFNTWWDGIKEVLDENVATNLQNQIDEINAKLNGENAVVGLLERSIANSFMSGDYGLNIKTFTIAPKTLHSAPTNYDVSRNMDFNGISMILPDGKILVFYTEHENDGRKTYYDVLLYTKDGVETSKTQESTSTAYAVAGNFEIINNISAQIDSYPVTVLFSRIALNPNSDGKQYCGTVKIQVTSSSEIYITENPATVGEQDIFFAANRFVLGNAVRLSDGSSIAGGYEYTTSDLSGDQHSQATFFKITSDGTISGYKTTTGMTYIRDATRHRFYLVDGVPTYWHDKTNYVTVDTSSLTATNHTGTKTEPNILSIGEATNYLAEAYALSEVGGVKIIKSEPNQKYSGLTTVKSSYFTGASNSNSSIYEGTYLAFKNDSDQLYGIGTDGSQIAIGSNGGAAFLKTKKGSISAGSFADIMKYYRGYLKTDNDVTYLFAPLNNTGNYSESTFTVIRLSKED